MTGSEPNPILVPLEWLIKTVILKKQFLQYVESLKLKGTERVLGYGWSR